MAGIPLWTSHHHELTTRPGGDRLFCFFPFSLFPFFPFSLFPFGVVLALISGWVSHSIADMMTKGGVCWFYPSRVRCVIPGNQDYRMRVMGWGEFWFAVIMCATTFPLYNAASTGQGTTGLIRQAIGNIDSARKVYDTQKGANVWWLEVEGKDNISQADITGRYEIIAGHGESGFQILIDEEKKTVCRQTSCDWFPEKAKVSKGSAQSTTIFKLNIFKQAIAKGLCSDNPAAATLKKRVKVQRQRMTLEQFHAIRAHADDWLQNCINLGLLTLQRREDLASLMWSDVHDGFIWIQQRKVEKWGTGNLKIRITPEIQAILDRSNDGVESEHVIHRRAHRRVHAAKRTDLNAVLPGLITKHFAAARLASGIFPSDQASATLPSFHEIRALGANQLEAQGKPPELIQALLGHTTKAMTDVYLDRHQIRWVEVDTQEY